MEKLFIGIFGGVNAGKSSVFNKLLGQEAALVSPRPGTTADGARRSIELAGIGPVTLIDTAGLDDSEATLGPARAGAALSAVDIVDMAIIVAACGVLSAQDAALMARLRGQNIPFFIVNNKSDLPGYAPLTLHGVDVAPFSAIGAADSAPILELIKKHRPAGVAPALLPPGLVKEGDIVVLLTPIDAAAPAGRLILPQVQVLRALLDARAVAIVLQPGELKTFLAKNPAPKLVITDSQAFAEVNAILPVDVPLTSFSMLFARFKGDLPLFLDGATAIAGLKDGDKVLILESCAHTANTCDDIGRVKLPALLRKKTGKELDFKIVPGLDPLPGDLDCYSLVLQCGGCMATRAQLLRRIARATAANVPVTNYGIAIAYCTGILDRVSKVFS